MEKFCISVDWLQTYCLGDVLTDGASVCCDGMLFKVKEQPMETAQFKRLFYIYEKGIHVATVQQVPRTSVINARTTLVKLENRVLYSQIYIRMIYAIQQAFCLQYKGITRLDICYDCNKLHGGRNVERFIKDYITVNSGEVGHIVRKGSARFQLHGTRKQTAASKYNSISWGSPKSKIRCYCYDKTLELAEVKDKPWIRKMWHDNGLLYDIDFDSLGKLPPKEREKEYDNIGFSDYVKERVWRFEISIGSQGQDILDMSTGELFRLSPKYMEHYSNICKLFYIYAEKVFNFRINTGQKNIRHYPRLQIFEDIPVLTEKQVQISHDLDTGRMEKVCYNKLKRLSEEYGDMAEQQREAIYGAMDFLATLAGKKRSIIKMNRTSRYLNELKSYRFLNDIDRLYFASIESVSEAKRDADPDMLYNMIIDTDYWLEIDKIRDNVPPEEYFY